MMPFHGLMVLAFRWLGSYDVWGVGPRDFYAGYEIEDSNCTRGGAQRPLITRDPRKPPPRERDSLSHRR